MDFSGFDHRKSILDIYKCPFSKSARSVCEKPWKKVTCDHYALISVFL